MKKFLLAAVSATLVATPILAAAPAAAAPQRHSTTVVRHKPGKTVVVKRNTVRAPAYRTNWRKGQRFDYHQARNYRQINNWQQYRGRHLYAPPRGYHWVQSGNDAVLVAVAGGLVGAVLAGAFN